MFYKKTNKVSSKFMFYTTIVVFIAIVLIALLYSLLQIINFKNDSDKVRLDFVENQKAIAKNEAEKVVDYINYTRMFIEDKMKTDLREKTIQAWLIADNIYRSNQGKASNFQMVAMIKDALRPIRFNKGRGYYFMVSMDGTELLYPVSPEFEGKNLLNLKDDKGTFVVQDEISVIKKQGEGFVTDYWTKPGGEIRKLYPKISYIKHYPAINAYIGCGEYLDNVEKDIQEEVIQKIKNIRFGKDGYIFVNTFEGKAVVIDSEKYKSGDTIWNLTDPDGVKVIQEETKMAKKKEGGFISYKWKKLNSSDIVSKVAFVKGVQEWNWIVGAGIYLDEIDAQISQDEKMLYTNLSNQILLSVIALVAIFIFLFILSKKLAAKIDRDFELFAQKLSLAVNSGTVLNKDDFNLMDLQIVAEKMNEVIKKKALVEDALVSNEALFRTVFENVPVMIGISKKSENVIKWNTQFRDLFNQDDENISKLNKLEDFITSSPINKNFDYLVADSHGLFWELEVNTRIGVRIQNWAHLHTINNEMVLVGYDITDIRENQQKLLELNATKDKFFSLIAHDLRGPIGSLNSFLDIFTQDEYKLSAEEMKINLEVMKVASNKTYQLLENLLTWARSQMNDIPFEPKLNNLKEVVDVNIKLFEYVAQEKEIQLVSNIDSDIPFIFDAEMVSTIIRNLINNALKFTNAKGIIIISAQIIGKNVAVKVEDTGLGMPPHVYETLFNIGSKKESMIGTSGEIGSGLGLILCKEFAEKHGGEISVKSKVGKGSTFTVLIPVR